LTSNFSLRSEIHFYDKSCDKERNFQGSNIPQSRPTCGSMYLHIPSAGGRTYQAGVRGLWARWNAARV